MSGTTEPTGGRCVAPDVSVVVAAYNTMPYLTHCLTSLVQQSIGRERMEIIAVDDGSTDGSGKELDRFARRYPGTVTVFHQANSGGPAAPSNRALDVARGRYVFFVGADDYLGREALERLVSAADRLDSDVVAGKVVGVNRRYVHQALFSTSDADIGLFDSALPWSLANTKLFRRELIERHGLRYPEHMPIGSDQPFTLEACVRAQRISVLADYDYYHAVRRLNARNITYRSRHDERLRSVAQLMNFVADLIQPGKQRDAILVRHFSWELAKLLGDDFLRLDGATQEQIHTGARELAELYLTEDIRDQLAVEARLRLSIAHRGSLDDLIAVIRQDAERGVPPTITDGDRWFASYPGFRDGPTALPDSCFDVTESAVDWMAKLDATSVEWESGDDGERMVTITARSPLPDLTALCSTPVRMMAGETPGVSTLVADSTGTAGSTGTTVRAQFLVDQLLADSAASGQRMTVRALVTAFGKNGVAPMRAPRLQPSMPAVCRRGLRLYVITPTRDNSGQFMVAITPVTPRRVIARLRRGWPRGIG